jgi:antitoxin (DNA-binding transcriptional repressor) of toxin-antitoxin stability system
MDYITTTQLRTKSSALVSSLEKGDEIKLVHRSKIVGIIKPAPLEGKPFDAEKFKNAIKNLNLPKTTYAQRDKIYRAHLEKKYGKSLS